jgi:predicted alpha/beta-fold hydrolase
VQTADLSELPPFRPRFPWWGGDLQTIGSRFIRHRHGPAPHSSERLSFALPDGTGDRLLAMLDTPQQPRPGRPLAILIHGLTGAEGSTYILSAARALLERGYRVLRLNLRGAGPSRATCGGQYYAGRSQDFRLLLALLPRGLMADGLVAVGYSLGGAMLLKYLGEEGAATPLKAAASVCAPIDLSSTCKRMMQSRNRLYHAFILSQMKVEATSEGAAISGQERTAILGSGSIWEYDDVFIGPRHGFAGAEDYYERCRPTRFMPGIRTPTLLLASGDDPWIPSALYRRYDWVANPALLPLLPDGGGHVGFHGAGPCRTWSDLAVTRFFERTVSCVAP